MQTIIIADDHELIREAIRPYLLQLAEGVVVLEASTTGETIDLCATARKSDNDVILIMLDLSMPGNPADDPFLGLRRVKQMMPDIPIVIFSANEDNLTVSNAIKNGAQGFIPKSTRGRSLVNALRLILAGEIYVPPSLATSESVQDPATPAATIGDGLTPRELESLRMLVKGLSNKEIARELGVQGVTIKLHLRNAYRKIGASNRVDAVRIAVEQNL